MSYFASPVRASEPEVYETIVQLLGTGAAVPTKVLGTGISISRTAAGRILLTWADNPGTFVGIGGWGFNAATQGDVKGHTVTASVYPLTASTYTLELDIWDSAFAAEDLEALEWLTVRLLFKRTGV